ncbi:hypothetical protein ElyMa_005096300 [Elysia marginata]|uniref:KIND domain-containing protein n=1 Tax=Elysia marginata TaxID=1093978 RepID=A0AAV4JJA0_9GAST|nr:hypothetical protein ElyMa_005096300 [Elysia marginata]
MDVNQSGGPEVLTFSAVLDSAREHGLAEERIQDLTTLCETILHQCAQNSQTPSTETSFYQHDLAPSSDDGYCPKGEVDFYERDMLKMLEDVFGTLTITKHYESSP